MSQIVKSKSEVELWRSITAIVGCEGYEVSNRGRVRSWWRRGPSGKMGDTPRILKEYPDPVYIVRANGEARIIARLVLLAFVGPPPEGKSLALHYDDDPSNNNLSNLRWGSHRDNAEDFRRNNGGPIFTDNCPHCGKEVRIIEHRLIEI